VSGGSTVIEAAHTNVLGSNAHLASRSWRASTVRRPVQEHRQIHLEWSKRPRVKFPLVMLVASADVALREGLEKTAWIEKTAQSLATGEGCSL
jgi:hypothetical protein